MSPAPIIEFGVEPRRLSQFRVAQAKRLMRDGYDLEQAAQAIGVRARDLDLSLWANLGSTPEEC